MLTALRFIGLLLALSNHVVVQVASQQENSGGTCPSECNINNISSIREKDYTFSTDSCMPVSMYGTTTFKYMYEKDEELEENLVHRRRAQSINPDEDFTQVLYGWSIEIDEQQGIGSCFIHPGAIVGPFPKADLEACIDELREECDLVRVPEVGMCPCFNQEVMEEFEESLPESGLDMEKSCKDPSENNGLPYGLYEKGGRDTTDLENMHYGVDMNIDKMWNKCYAPGYRQGENLVFEGQQAECVSQIEATCSRVKTLDEEPREPEDPPVTMPEVGMCPCFNDETIARVEKAVEERGLGFNYQLSCKEPESNGGLPYGLYSNKDGLDSPDFFIELGVDMYTSRMINRCYIRGTRPQALVYQGQQAQCVSYLEDICSRFETMGPADDVEEPEDPVTIPEEPEDPPVTIPEIGMCPCYNEEMMEEFEENLKNIRYDRDSALDMERSCKDESENNGLPYGLYTKRGMRDTDDYDNLQFAVDVNDNKMLKRCYTKDSEPEFMNLEGQHAKCVQYISDVCSRLKLLTADPTCSDDREYRHRSLSWRSCDYIVNNHREEWRVNRNCNRYDTDTGKFVFEHCRKSCQKCSCRSGDNPDYSYNGQEDFTCEWIRNQPNNRTERFCQDSDAAINCPNTCGTGCCKNDPDFRFNMKKIKQGDNRKLQRRGNRVGCNAINNSNWMEICEKKRVAANCPMSCRKCIMQLKG